MVERASRFPGKWRQHLLLFLPPIAVTVARRLRYLRVPHTGNGGRIRIPYGEFVLQCDASHHLPAILAVLPEFGRPLADIVNALGVPEPRVVDVGANIGDTALLLARFAPGARVLCIEGNDCFMADLETNLAQVTGVTAVKAILAERSASVRGRFAMRQNHGGTAHITLDEAGDLLKTQTLDDLLASYPEFRGPHAIKIDTDGFDPSILRGARRTLTDARPVVFYEWDPYSYRMAGENDVGHAEFLMELAYERFLIFTNSGQPLLRVCRPGREIWESLARFSLGRRSLDGWHYDIAAFPTERADILERVWRHYSEAPREIPTPSEPAQNRSRSTN
jgi:FkbM family methyltransferase